MAGANNRAGKSLDPERQTTGATTPAGGSANNVEDVTKPWGVPRQLPWVIRGFSGFFGTVAVVLGIIEAVVGMAIFPSWGEVGAFWVGFLSVGAGAAGFYLQSAAPGTHRLASCVMLGFCSSAIICALVALLTLDGQAYQNVIDAEECFEAEQVALAGEMAGLAEAGVGAATDQLQGVVSGDAADVAAAISTCAATDHHCACIQTDKTVWCLDFWGECNTVPEFEEPLLASTALLSIILINCSVLATLGLAAVCHRERQPAPPPTAAGETASASAK